MNTKISTNQPPENIAKILEVLTETPIKLEALSKGLPKEKLREPLGKGERSSTEDITHLINGEARSSEMMYQALLSHEPLFADVHPDRDWGKLTRFDLLDFSDLLDYFKTRRKILLRVLSGLKEAKWSRTIREEGKKRKESAYWRARALASHELDHIQDLEKKLGK
jgi:hypothetical protein